MQKRQESLSFLVSMLFLAAFGSLSFFVLFGSGPSGITGYAIYVQNDSSSFNNGTYQNTEHNGSGVVLSSGQTSGTYLSEIFDAGSPAEWTTVNLSATPFSSSRLFGVDNGGEVYVSDDFGLSWNLSEENYGRDSVTSHMATDGTYFYILSGSAGEVWRSDDAESFSVIASGFSWYSLEQIAVAPDASLYVLDAGGGVYRSSDEGGNWTLQGDLTGAYDNAEALTAAGGSLFALTGPGAVYRSDTNGTSWTVATANYGGSWGTDDLVSDSSENLYILFNKAVYSSDDSGASWGLINTSFTSYAQDGVRMGVDGSDRLYITDSIGRVFSSEDSGVSWTLQGDLNGGASNEPRGITSLDFTTSVLVEARNCSESDCSDGSFLEVNDSLGLVSDYFQYRLTFSTPFSGTSTVSSTVVDYTILNSAPNITLFSPLPQLYLSNDSFDLNYSILDLEDNLDSCWYTLDFGVTNITLGSCTNTTFSASEGSYVLIVYANDSLGFVGNRSVSFDVDATGVFVSIGSPSGTVSSRTNISLTYNVTGENTSCWYAVNNSVGGSVLGTTPLSNCSPTLFSVPSDGDYVLYVSANNSFGNNYTLNRSFTVSSVVLPDDDDDAPSSSGGGGGGSSPSVSVTRLELEPLDSLLILDGDSRTLTLRARNGGTNFLNSCIFSAVGNTSSWVIHEEEKSLSPGELYDFVFDLAVPETTPHGAYTVLLDVTCEEAREQVLVGVEIIEEKLSFELLSVERARAESVVLSYSLSELSAIDQDVSLEFLLLDSGGSTVVQDTSHVYLPASETLSLDHALTIDSSVEGELTLIVNLNSEQYSAVVQEEIILGTPLSGYSIFEGEGSTTWVSVLVFLLFIGFFVWRFIAGLHEHGTTNPSASGFGSHPPHFSLPSLPTPSVSVPTLPPNDHPYQVPSWDQKNS